MAGHVLLKYANLLLLLILGLISGVRFGCAQITDHRSQFHGRLVPPCGACHSSADYCMCTTWHPCAMCHSYAVCHPCAACHRFAACRLLLLAFMRAV